MYEELEKEARYTIRRVLSLGNTLDQLLTLWTNFDKFESFIMNSQNDLLNFDFLKQNLEKCSKIILSIQNIPDISSAVGTAAEKRFKKLQKIVENVCFIFLIFIKPTLATLGKKKQTG